MRSFTMTRGGQTYHYFYDGLGSVSDIANSAGAVVESYDYDVYGQPTTTSAIGNPFYFTGRRLDAETGLYYYRARMYSPTIGRFLQRDPIGYYDSMNLMQYVGNNPTNWVDPWGLSTSQSSLQDYLKRMAPVMPDFSYVQKIATLEGAAEMIAMLTPIGEAGMAAEVCAMGRQTTVIGSRADTLKYLGRAGYNVLNIKNWTPVKNIKWLDKAIERGDRILLATDPIKHQELMQSLNKASSYLDLELPHLFERGFVQWRKFMIR